MTDKEAYVQLQSSCGIKVGDQVKILRKAKSGEMGWGCKCTKGMDLCVGKCGKVINFAGYMGVTVKIMDCEYSLPFYVLEKIKPTYLGLCEDLKAGDPCLVRNKNDNTWENLTFKGINEVDFPFYADDFDWKQCLPYDGYEKYLNITDSPLDE